MIAAPALLGVTLAYLALVFSRGHLWGRKVPSVGEPPSAARVHLLWSVGLFAQFGLPALLGLALLGRGLGTPPEFAPLMLEGGALPIMVVLATMPLAIAAGFFLSRRRARLGRTPRTLLPVAEPRTWGEIGPPLLLSVSAAVWEELFFRLFLPLLLVLVTGQVLLAFVLSALLFGLGHSYQKLAGAVMAAVMGAALSVVYLIGGSLWMAMLLHFALLANVVVVRPISRWGVAAD